MDADRHPPRRRPFRRPLRPPVDRPSAPAAAWYVAIDAIEAVDNDEHDHGDACTYVLTHPLGIGFTHPDDIGAARPPIIVWSARPQCVIVEMRRRGCIFTGLPSLAYSTESVRCPRTLEGMPW